MPGAGRVVRGPCCGGDCDALWFSVPPRVGCQVSLSMEFSATPVSRIVGITAEPQVRVLDSSGEPWQPLRAGYNHFA